MISRDSPYQLMGSNKRKKETQTIVRHSQNGNLSDGTVTALDSSGTFVHGGQVSIHITGVTTSTRNFFSCSGDLSKSVTVGGEISHDNQDVLLQLVGVVLGSGQGKTRGDDTFNSTARLAKTSLKKKQH